MMRPLHRLESHYRSSIARRLRFIAVALAVCVILPQGAAAQSTSDSSPVPVFAYYYIWYTPGSWDRAKTDYPLLGRYSSDDPAIMREHIRMAKLAGIDGFIVSWKSTEPLNRRLEQLIEIAESEDFKLAMIYQGLDFERRPLLAETIGNDLDYFVANFADSPAFDIFAKPVVIWSGTWKFSPDTIAAVAEARREQLLILASERNVAGYERIESVVDGNAYYWSSVDPETFPNYQEKLDALSETIHAQGGLWIAPVAPGFDARLIGGRRVVERREGKTLRQQYDVAMKSNPDMIGLISWNEFSENSHIEPSRKLHSVYLEIMADISGAPVPDLPFFDSDEAIDAPLGISISGINPPRVVFLGMLGSIIVACALIVVRRGLGKEPA